MEWDSSGNTYTVSLALCFAPEIYSPAVTEPDFPPGLPPEQLNLSGSLCTAAHRVFRVLQPELDSH